MKMKQKNKKLVKRNLKITVNGDATQTCLDINIEARYVMGNESGVTFTAKHDGEIMCEMLGCKLPHQLNWWGCQVASVLACKGAITNPQDISTICGRVVLDWQRTIWSQEQIYLQNMPFMRYTSVQLVAIGSFMHIIDSEDTEERTKRYMDCFTVTVEEMDEYSKTLKEFSDEVRKVHATIVESYEDAAKKYGYGIEMEDDI